MLICASFIQNINTRVVGEFPVVSGSFVKNYMIPLEWSKYDNSLILCGWMGVKTKDGIFFVEPEEIKEVTLNDGDYIIFNATRFDLLAWHPIE